MSGRRRRDGELNPDDGEAQAVGPRSTSAPRGRQHDEAETETGAGAEAGAEAGADDTRAPRVRGAWTTPAVVVRRPDGSVVPHPERGAAAGGDRRPGRPGAARTRPRAVASTAAEAPDAGSTPPAQDGAPGPADGSSNPSSNPSTNASSNRSSTGPAAGRRPRVRPRRIPGAPGAVLLSPTLSDAADGREARRRRRTAAVAASTTPLPPRPSASTDDAAAKPSTARPSLRSVTGAASKGMGRLGSRRGTSSDGDARRSRPGERRRQRVLQAVAGLNFDRLLPGDDEARERRAARLRRIGTRVGTVALAGLLVYGVFPVRTWIDQRAATDRARERLEVFERENELLADEKSDLSGDERIEEEAREMGMVLPGEELYRIHPPPEAPAAEPGSASTTSTTQPGG